MVLTRPALGFELSFGRFTSAGEVTPRRFFCKRERGGAGYEQDNLQTEKVRIQLC